MNQSQYRVSDSRFSRPGLADQGDGRPLGNGETDSVNCTEHLLLPSASRELDREFVNRKQVPGWKVSGSHEWIPRPRFRNEDISTAVFRQSTRPPRTGQRSRIGRNCIEVETDSPMAIQPAMARHREWRGMDHQ